MTPRTVHVDSLKMTESGLVQESQKAHDYIKSHLVCVSELVCSRLVLHGSSCCYSKIFKLQKYNKNNIAGLGGARL